MHSLLIYYDFNEGSLGGSISASLGREFGKISTFIFQVILFIINCIYFIFIDDKNTPIICCKIITTFIKMVCYIITECLLFDFYNIPNNGYEFFFTRIAFMIVSIIILSVSN